MLELDVNLLKTELGIVAFGKRVRTANAIAELRRPPPSPSSEPQMAAPPSQPLASPAPQMLHSPFSATFGNGTALSPDTSYAVGELRSMSPSVFLSAPSSPPTTPGINGNDRPVSPAGAYQGLVGLGIPTSITSPGMLETTKNTVSHELFV